MPAVTQWGTLKELVEQLKPLATYFAEQQKLIEDQKKYTETITRATKWTMVATIVMAVAVTLQAIFMGYSALHSTAHQSATLQFGRTPHVQMLTKPAHTQQLR